MPPSKTAPAAATGPLFPASDPEGRVLWTPALRRKVFPRRELGLKPPKPGDLAALLAHLRGHVAALWGPFEAGARHPANDPALTALRHEARAWLDATPPPDTLRPAQAAVLFQLLELCDGMRADSLQAGFVDLLVARFGVEFALRTLAEAFAIVRVKLPEGESLVVVPLPNPRRGYSGPSVSVHFPAYALVRAEHARVDSLDLSELDAALAGTRTLSLYLFCTEFVPWLRLREHLAGLAPAAWETLRDAVAGPLYASSSLVARHMIAWSFPECPPWAEALATPALTTQHGLYPMLTACLPDPSVLPAIQCEYFFEHFAEACTSMLAAAGPRAVPALLALGRRLRVTAEYRAALALVAHVDTDEAVGALLAEANNPRFAQSLSLVEANFPARVKALRGH